MPLDDSRDDARTLERLAAEMVSQEAHPMQLNLRPESAFMLVGLLQLALRHPHLPPNTREFACMVVIAARTYFKDCPTVLDVMRRGDDPREDAPPDTTYLKHLLRAIAAAFAER